MRKYTYILLLANLVLVDIQLCGQPTTQSARQQAIEALISYHERMEKREPQLPTDPEPAITFHAYINHKTTLKDLAKIKRRVAKRFGIQLAFHDLEFSNMGLSRILVDARSADSIYQTTVTGNLTNCTDFGVFEITYGTIKQYFIGSHATWPERLHLLIAKRS
jgi:hypothetical protein